VKKSRGRKPFSAETCRVLSERGRERWARYHEDHPKPLSDLVKKRKKHNRHCVRRTHGLGG